MPTYKLYYFNSKGRGELARLIFAQADVQYEDIRFEYGGERWIELKPTMPFGQVPVLEVDGTRIDNSMVIARYLAEEFGLAGSNSLENSKLAGIVEAVNDIFAEMAECIFETNEEKKAQLQKTFKEKTAPFVLAKFETLSSANESGYLWGNKLTWADLAYFNLISTLTQSEPAILDNYPSLNKLKETIETLPKIAKWLRERPETKY